MKKNQKQLAVSKTEAEATNMVIESTGNELIIAPDEMGNHPNFIESNTSAITLEELTNKNIIPTFCDNTLTIRIRILSVRYQKSQNRYSENSRLLNAEFHIQ